MSIRKRTWTNAKGVEKEAWIVDYVDGKGMRRLKTFAKKKDADAFAATATVESQGRRPRRRQRQRHGKAGRRVLARQCRGLGPRAHDDRQLPLACRFAHRPIHRRHEALGAEHSGGAVIRGRSARGRAVAGDDPQGAGQPRHDARRCAGEGPYRSQRGARHPRSSEGRREAPGEASARPPEGRRRHSDPRRGEGHCRRPGGPLEAFAADGDIHRAARFRIAWAALERRRSRRPVGARPSACRSVQRDRPAEVRSRRANRAGAADRRERFAGMETDLPEARHAARWTPTATRFESSISCSRTDRGRSSS